MKKFAIIQKAKRQAFLCFSGIAIPHQPSVANGVYTPIKSEKVLKFNRSAMREIVKHSAEKVDSRYIGGTDSMRFKVGKPGSKERVEALALQYASLSEDEMSPFTME